MGNFDPKSISTTALTRVDWVSFRKRHSDFKTAVAATCATFARFREDHSRTAALPQVRQLDCSEHSGDLRNQGCFRVALSRATGFF
jgi:hypothetical protein